MIYVTRLNGQSYLLNSRLIESAEEKPDTTLTLTSGKVVIIRESLEELQQRIIDYEADISHRIHGLELKQKDN